MSPDHEAIHIKVVRIEQDMRHCAEKLDKVLHHLEGNGREGLITRVDKLETRWATIRWFFGLVVAGMLSLLGAVVAAFKE